jgi:hypothetical protein
MSMLETSSFKIFLILLKINHRNRNRNNRLLIYKIIHLKQMGSLRIKKDIFFRFKNKIQEVRR